VKRTLRWAALAAFGFVSAPSLAFDNYTFTAALQGGLGGALDVDGEDPFDQQAVQLTFGMLTQDRTHAVVRLGRLEFDADRPLGGRFGAEVDYVNVAGEYRFRQPAYDFGLFLGIGAYRVSGDPLPGIEDEEEAVGFVLGATGDFDVSRHFSIVGEVDFHYALFDDANLYGAALVGVAVHF
jgi:hypothetical protein